MTRKIFVSREQHERLTRAIATIADFEARRPEPPCPIARDIVWYFVGCAVLGRSWVHGHLFETTEVVIA